MDVKINRLDPNVPDPVESRRRAAGRLVRFAYATVVFGVLGFFVIYFGAPFVYLTGPGTVTAPRHVVSLPYTAHPLRSGHVAAAAEHDGRRSHVHYTAFSAHVTGVLLRLFGLYGN